MLKKILFPLAGGMLLASQAGALSLQESLIAANNYNAEMSAARSEHDADGQKRHQGLAGLLPAISLDGSWIKTDQPDAAYSAGVTRHNYSINLTQPLFDMEKYATWRKSVVISDLADVNLLIAQQKLIASVTTAYYGVLYQRRVLETHHRSVKAFSAQLKQTRKALEIGDGTRLDLAEAQASYDKAVADELMAENELNDASVIFHQLTGLDPQAIPDSSMRCLRYTEKILPEQLRRDAAANNLDVLAAIQTHKASEADILTATSGHMPVVTLQAGYGKNWSRAENGNYLDTLFGTTSKTDNTQISVNVSLPLFGGGRPVSQSLEAAHRFAQSKDLITDARRKAEQQAIQAASGVLNSQSQIKAYQRAITSADKRLRATRYGREIGQRTLIDEFNAEKDYFRTVQDLAQAQNALIQAIVKLKTATGSLDYAAIQNLSCDAA
ncbi:TolC family outer membrane protein [Pantoea anthophila]|uniref:TolC family outer membrane protein n=1 Tax=Pantoea anthophila TaxID=470931 RepID=UPI002DBB61A8|nr:TolC family outer membrane protein [Pantoea anthophila]MEB7540286.1 TolC family outer membrane protein [Pantoea anthophila]